MYLSLSSTTERMSQSSGHRQEAPAVAYHLARDGHGTVLVDREDEGRATDAGAGILLSPTSSRNASNAWFRLAAPAVQCYPDLVAELHETGVEVTGYTQCGLLAVAMDADAVATFERTEQRLRDRQAAMGYPAERQSTGSRWRLPSSASRRCRRPSRRCTTSVVPGWTASGSRRHCGLRDGASASRFTTRRSSGFASTTEPSPA